MIVDFRDEFGDVEEQWCITVDRISIVIDFQIS